MEENTINNTEELPLDVAEKEIDAQEELQNALNLIGVKTKMEEFSAFKAKVQEEEEGLFKNKDDLAYLEQLLDNYTEADIEKFDNAKVDELYTDPEGNLIELYLTDVPESRMYEIKKEFLLYKKKVKSAIEEMDKTQSVFEKEYTEQLAELNSLVEKFDDVNAAMKFKLQERLDNSELPEHKKYFQTMIDAMDEAFDLRLLYTTYRPLRPSNQIRDYIVNGKPMYGKFLKIVKKLNIKTDLSRFPALELTLLPKKYHQYPDFFLFLVFKSIIYRKHSVSKEWDGMFLSQLAYNLSRAIENKMREDQKEQFISNIVEVLDLFQEFYPKEEEEMCDENQVNEVNEVEDVPCTECVECPATEVCPCEEVTPDCPCECEAPVEETAVEEAPVEEVVESESNCACEGCALEEECATMQEPTVEE